MNIDFTTIYEKMPDFRSHNEARDWFKDQFGERFKFKNEDVIEGEKVYYYHVVKNQEIYEGFMENLTIEEADITSMKPFESYSTIEISEDGGISFSI